MTYERLLAKTMPSSRRTIKEVYQQMVACTELTAALKEANTTEEAEECFRAQGFGNAPLEARTPYLLWIMGMSNSFEDMGAMRQVVANHKKREADKAWENQVGGIKGPAQVAEAAAGATKEA